MNKFLITLIVGLIFISHLAIGQSPKPEPKLLWNFDESGKYYVRATFLNQVWFTHTQNNPGSAVFGTPVDQEFNIGLRRTRLQLYGQLSDKVFFYTQFGQNNFTYLTPRYTGSFFHDALVEYKVADKKLSLGGGLCGWNGLARYASPSIGSILTLDAPLYLQATNGVNDQFLRKLSIYAKGKLGKLDYRMMATKPMVVQNSTAKIDTISRYSNFSLKPPQFQWQGYFMYQFLDQESNTTPYTTGSYLGTKKVFNVGIGAIYQPDAVVYVKPNGDTATDQMLLYGLDVFYDAPLNIDKGNAITIYAAAHHFDFGPGYIRNIGVMNPTNSITSRSSFNGTGNAFPMIGTGDVFYCQAGYLLKRDLLKNGARIQPYAAMQYANYERLEDAMVMTEFGVNYFIHGSHSSKLSINYQNRPVYTYERIPFANSLPLNGLFKTDSRSMIQLQYQVSI